MRADNGTNDPRSHWRDRDWQRKLRGFYAIIDRQDIELAQKLLDAGTGILQLRLKPAPDGDELVGFARQLRQLTRERDVIFIINDRLDVARAVQADGIHLGQTDLSPVDVRPLFRHGLIGFSTHDAKQIERAATLPIDYLGFGPVFGTRTKDKPDPTTGVDTLRAVIPLAHGKPVVAIGGITPDNAEQLADTGVLSAAAIASVNDASDPTAAGKTIAAHFGVA